MWTRAVSAILVWTVLFGLSRAMPEKMDISEASRFHLKSESWVNYPPLTNMFTEADLRPESDDETPTHEKKGEPVRGRENFNVLKYIFFSLSQSYGDGR